MAEPAKDIKLKVTEAIQDDVNKGIVRIDSGFMHRIDVRPGDIIEIEGTRKTVALVDRAYPSDIGLDFIRMDNLARKNARTSIGEQVSVRKAEVKEAKKVVIAPAKEGIVVKASPSIFKQGLLGRAVVKGDIISLGGTRRRRNAMTGSPFFDEVFPLLDEASMMGFGFSDLRFTVVETNPKQAVIITDATEIQLNPEAVEVKEETVPDIAYEDIGGLKDEITKVREMVELPLRHPEIFERLGIEPPKGVLLHGPPGTGKTLMAKAVANETNSHFVLINGPEIMSKYYGQSLPGDEKLLVLDNGSIKRVPIQEIVEKQSKIKVACFDKKGKVVWSPVTGWITHPRRSKLVELTTASGRHIRVTEDHSVFTLTKKGIESVPTNNLTPNTSFIAVPKQLPHTPVPIEEINLLKILKDNDNGLVVKNPKTYLVKAIEKLGRATVSKLLNVSEKYTYDVVCKDVGISVSKFITLMKCAHITVNEKTLRIGTKGKGTSAVLKLSPALCHFFGWWIAEGSYTTKNEVRLSLNAQEVNGLISLCTTLFKKVLVYRKTANSADIYICAGVLGKIMQAIGFTGHAREKHVPEFVFSLSKENLAAFLQGYISGDGSVNRTTPAPQVELTTESPALADDLCHLLLRFGIAAKVYNRPGRPQKRICFADVENLKRFLDIGFVDDKRNAFIKEYIATAPGSRRDRVPLTALEGIDSAWNGCESIGTQALLKQMTIPAQLVSALEGDILWDKLTSVKVCDTQPDLVYDISVEPCQNFIAGFGGIFAHNSEENLRKKFEEAEKNAPSIIFIDEIDAIASKREETRGEVERRVVAQMLALMDGLKSRGRVVVIAATNVPNILDPALRRPGRFDRELEIGVPNKEGRLNILTIHTRNMPMSKDVNLKDVASITHGFVGADLASLTKESAMIVLRRVLPDLKYDKEEAIPNEILEKLIISKNDFKEALKVVRPSALREVLIEIPNIRWEDVGGLTSIKQELMEAVEWPLKHPDAFKRLGVKPPKGILLYGPPGTGKTLLAKAVAKESEANFISIKGPELLSKWVGESEKAVREIFKKARQAAPVIIFFDELDSLAPRRGASTDSGVTERVVNQLLTEIDGLEALHDIVIIGATNRPDIIDTALLRPGRFDRIIMTPVPDTAVRLQIFKIHAKNMPIKIPQIAQEIIMKTDGTTDNHITSKRANAASKINVTSKMAGDEAVSNRDFDKQENKFDVEKIRNVEDLLKVLANNTEGYVGADIESVCREAAILALRENIAAKSVEERHFMDALKKVHPSVTKAIEKTYKDMQDQFTQARAKEMQEEKPVYFG